MKDQPLAPSLSPPLLSYSLNMEAKEIAITIVFCMKSCLNSMIGTVFRRYEHISLNIADPV